MRPCFAFILLAIALPCVAADDAQEKYPSGTVKEKYSTEGGKKNGPFSRFYENGHLRAKGNYKAGRLDGELLLYYLGGKLLSKSNYKEGKLNGEAIDYGRNGALVASATYAAGVLQSIRVSDGKEMIEQQFKNGLPRCPARYAELQEAFAKINATDAEAAKGNDIAAERVLSLHRLQEYRALVGVPYDGLVLTADMNKAADAAAEICQAINRLDHTPPNPGWAKDKYDFASKATRLSNLASSTGRLTLAGSVDMYMDDSDASNIDRVGHRRWCINPTMQIAGFGKSPSGHFAAMMAHDASRKAVPEWDFTAFPPAGLAPPGYFKAEYAWSVSPNLAKYGIPDPNQVKITVSSKTDPSPDKPGVPLKLNYSGVETKGFGSGAAIIFRPEGLSVAPGSRYSVKIEGIVTKSGKATIEYLVWFTP